MELGIIDGINVRGRRVHNYPPRWNAAPSHELPCPTISPYLFDLAARRLALAARSVQKPFACRDQFTATYQFDAGV
jgi:hypothetical protein